MTPDVARDVVSQLDAVAATIEAGAVEAGALELQTTLDRLRRQMHPDQWKELTTAVIRQHIATNRRSAG